MFELRHLRHALGLAESRNFARAAEALHISQPALSRSIQSLEEQLGVRLFDRDQGGVEPTLYGQLLLARARELDLAARDLEREIELAKGMAQGELKIGLGPWGASMLAGEVVGAMSVQYPQLRLTLVIGPWQELPGRLISREIDLAVVNISDIPADGELAVQPLGEHPILLVCRGGHPLTQLAQPTVSEVFRYPLAGPEMPASSENQLLSYLTEDMRAAALREGLVRINCDSSPVLKSIVINSDAITPMNAFMVLDELRSGQLKVVPGMSLGTGGQFGVVRLRRRSLSNAAQRFMDLLSAHDAVMLSRENAYFCQIK